jgi:glutamate racemase
MPRARPAAPGAGLHQQRERKMTISVFDSGIGGLTVLKEALRILPHENYLYYADTRNVPYGTKPKAQVLGYIEAAVDFIARQNTKALVIACNTATSVAVNLLRQKYAFPIIGMEPAVKPAIDHFPGNRILVTATSLTLREEKLKKLIMTHHAEEFVDSLALDKLVLFAERFVFDGPEVEQYFEEQLAPLDIRQYAAIVLGCTHFLYFKDLLRRKLGGLDIPIIDGNEGTVKNLQRILGSRNLLARRERPFVRFFNSDGPESDPRKLQKMHALIGRTIDPLTGSVLSVVTGQSA